METVIFDGEDGTELEFGILEQTRVGGVNYLLVMTLKKTTKKTEVRRTF